MCLPFRAAASCYCHRFLPVANFAVQIHAVQGHLLAGPWQQGNRSGPGVLPVLLESIARPDDIFVVHVGLWHRRSRPEVYNSHLHALGKLYQQLRGKFPNWFFMETPKQHFDSPDGDFDEAWVGARSGPFICQPVPGVALGPNGSVAAQAGSEQVAAVVHGTWRNAAVHSVLERQYGMPVLPVYNSTVSAVQPPATAATATKTAATPAAVPGDTVIQCNTMK